MYQKRCGPRDLLARSACSSFCLVVAEGGCVCVELCAFRIREKLPLGSTEDAPRVRCDVYRGNLLPCLSFACSGGVEACFDGVVLGG